MRNGIFYLSVALLGLVAVLGVYVVSHTLHQADIQPPAELAPAEETFLVPVQPASALQAKVEPTTYQASEVIITARAPGVQKPRGRARSK